MDLQGLLKELQGVYRSFFKNESIILYENTVAADVDYWDSLTHLELIHTVESKFGIQFSFDEVISFQNVGDMLHCIAKKLS